MKFKFSTGLNIDCDDLFGRLPFFKVIFVGDKTKFDPDLMFGEKKYGFIKATLYEWGRLLMYMETPYGRLQIFI